MRTVYKTSLSPKSILHENGLQNKPVTKKRKGLHTRKTNIQENSLITKQAFHQKAFSMKTFYKTSLHPKKQENSLQKSLSPKQSAKLSAGKRMPSVTSKYQTFNRWFTIKWQSCVSRKILRLPAKMSTVLLY